MQNTISDLHWRTFNSQETNYLKDFVQFLRFSSAKFGQFFSLAFLKRGAFFKKEYGQQSTRKVVWPVATISACFWNEMGLRWPKIAWLHSPCRSSVFPHSKQIKTNEQLVGKQSNYQAIQPSRWLHPDLKHFSTYVTKWHHVSVLILNWQAQIWYN